MTTREETAGRVIGELTRVVGGLLETAASSRTAAARSGDGFLVAIAARDGQPGELRIYFERAGALLLAAAVSGQPEPPDAALGEALKEVCARLLDVLGRHGGGSPLVAMTVEPIADLPEPSVSAAAEIVLAGIGQPVYVAVDGDLPLAGAEAGRPGRSQTLDVILDIDLPLVVRFGRTELPLKTLAALGPGSVIDLERSPDDMVDVLISNRVVARGDVVIVAGNYGVRVREVVSAVERARSLDMELA